MNYFYTSVNHIMVEGSPGQNDNILTEFLQDHPILCQQFEFCLFQLLDNQHYDAFFFNIDKLSKPTYEDAKKISKQAVQPLYNNGIFSSGEHRQSMFNYKQAIIEYKLDYHSKINITKLLTKSFNQPWLEYTMAPSDRVVDLKNTNDIALEAASTSKGYSCMMM